MVVYQSKVMNSSSEQSFVSRHIYLQETYIFEIVVIYNAQSGFFCIFGDIVEVVASL